MAMKRVRLASPAQLVLEVDKLQAQTKNAVVRAMQKTAEFGRTAVERTIAKTSPKPVATNTYRQAWAARKTKNGAILGNTARHAIFVEVGRRPGKPPPYAAILEWVKIKGIKPRAFVEEQAKEKAARGRARTARSAARKRNAVSRQASKTLKDLSKRYDRPSGSRPKPPKTPAQKKAAKQKSKQRANARKAKAAGKLRRAQEAFALVVMMKIAKRGVTGRYVLARTLPKIGKYAKKQTKIEVKRMLSGGGP